MGWVLRLMGGAGVVLFGMFLALTYLSPIHVERHARGFIQSQIERQIKGQFEIGREDAGDTRIGRLAKVMAKPNNEEVTALREELARGLRGQVAANIARMQDLTCECRERLQRGLEASTRLRISTLERAEPQLRRFIEGRYSEIVAGLLRDLRIFAVANLVAFLLILALSFLKPGQVRQLVVPGILLSVAAVTASALYLLGQNWFSTLLYGDFVGWFYGLWLLLIFGLLADIILFKARITTQIADVFSAGPC